MGVLSLYLYICATASTLKPLLAVYHSALRFMTGDGFKLTTAAFTKCWLELFSSEERAFCSSTKLYLTNCLDIEQVY